MSRLTPVTATVPAVTVTLQVANTEGLLWDFAVMVAVPEVDPALTTPSETDAMLLSEEVHTRVLSEASAGNTVALRVRVWP